MLEFIGASATIVDGRNDVIYDRSSLISSILSRTSHLETVGLNCGDRAVIASRDAASVLVDLFSCWQCGLTAIIVPPDLTTHERTLVASTTHAKVWIGESSPLNIMGIESAGLVESQEARNESLLHAGRLSLDEPALILMTSGTTSTPKGVVHSLRSIKARLALNLSYINTSDLLHTLNILPLHFGHGLIGNTLTSLSGGAKLVLWPDPGVEGLGSLGSIIDKYQITFLSSVPAAWRLILRLSSPPTRRTLRRIHIGSAPLAADLWEQVATWSGIRRVVNMYGITETANWIGGFNLEDGPAEDGLVGKPWGGMYGILSSENTIGRTGEGAIVVSTPSQMTGYFEREDLNKKVCVGSWFATGDNGSIDEDGNLRLKGRRQNEINRGGLKVSAEEIDLLLERHPAVLEACAFPIEDQIAGEIVAAAVVFVKGMTLTESDLITWCTERIRPVAVPSRIFVLEALPRTDRGKLNREKVRQTVVVEYKS